MNAGDAIVVATTLHLDEDQAQTYFDGLVVGAEANDAQQFVGAAGTAKISGTGAGELPSVDYELQCADWQEQQGVTRSTNTQYQGNKPAIERGIGGFFIGDANANIAPTVGVARAVMKVGEVDIDPGMKVDPIPDPNGVNGIGGFVRMPSAPKIKFTSIFSEDMPGLNSDFTTPTAKQILCQFGHQQGACVGVEIQRAWIDQAPIRKSLAGFAGVEITAHGDEGVSTGMTSPTDLHRSSLRVHIF
jgi:hypothetical protein